MPSFQISIEPGRRAAARFVIGVRRKILQALEEENEKRGMKQTDLARAMRVHRSVINRELRGKKDLKLGRVAEYAEALGRVAQFDLPERTVSGGTNLYDTNRCAAPVPPKKIMAGPPNDLATSNFLEEIRNRTAAPVPVV
jgi:hypothetical protein